MSSLKIEDALRRSQEMFVDNISVVQKHRVADNYYKVVEEETSSLADKGITATLMNNFAKVADNFNTGMNGTYPTVDGRNVQSDFGPYVMEIWPLVTAWYAEFPLKDLISVQSMDKPLGYLFFSKLLTGTNKSDTAVGDVVETALGSRKLKGKYPTGEIFGEEVPSAQLNSDTTGYITTILAYYPLNVEAIPGYLDKIAVTVQTSDTDSTKVVELRAMNVVGSTVHLKVKGQSEDCGATIDVSTGLVKIPTIISKTLAGTNTDITIAKTQKWLVNYVWNLDYADVDNIQRVKEYIEMVPMEAVPRALALEWSIFSEYLKKTQFGQDIRKDNIQRILSLLYQYQVRYILDEMYDYAEGNIGHIVGNDNEAPYEVLIPASSAISLDVKAQSVLADLKNIANIIEINSGRIEGNRIVCGKNFKSFCESLPNTWFQPSASATNYGFSTPREIGKFSTFTVYYDPTRGAEEAFMTYRGSEFYDASYYLAEYLPITPTDAVTLAVTVRSSFVSMEAYKYHKPNCVVRLTFKDSTI